MRLSIIILLLFCKQMICLAESGFIKNHGQWQRESLYEAEIRGGKVLIYEDRIQFLYIDPEDSRAMHPLPERQTDLKVRMHSFSMSWKNQVEKEKIFENFPSTHYYNYFIGKERSKWIGNVNSFSELIIPNVFEGIDLKAELIDKTFKYSFIVKPGADPSNIKLVCDDANGIQIINGDLIIGTSVGEHREPAPIVYQLHPERDIYYIRSRFMLNENQVGFSIDESYDRTRDLVVDPSVIFSGFSGSMGDNWGYAAAYDSSGNFYAAGISLGGNFPIVPGAFQVNYAGGGIGGAVYGCDAVLSKFSSDGSQLLWSTFLGGSDNEQIMSISVNDNGQPVVLGRTWSANFPVGSTSFDQDANGGSDFFITLFENTGAAIIGSTFLGGSADDGVNTSANFIVSGGLKYTYGDDARSDIRFGSNGFIYGVGSTQSANFPVNANAAQNTFGGGMQDGIVFCFNPDLSFLIWTTYLGGSGMDAIYSLDLEESGGIIVCGATSSSDLNAGTNTVGPAYSGGNSDGFVARLDEFGNQIKALTYLGTSGADQSYFLDIGKDHNIYLTGLCEGMWPIIGNVYSVPGSRQFVCSLDTTFSSYNFSTVFGGGDTTPSISASAFKVDDCGFIYFSGWGRCFNSVPGYPGGNLLNFPVTADAVQSTTDGCDLYVMVLSPSAGNLSYASFLGGAISVEHVDGGTSRISDDGVLYQSICTGCGGMSDYPVSTGVYAPVNVSPNCSNAMLKMNLRSNSLVASFNADTSGCHPFTSNFQNNSIGANQFLWDFGDGSGSTFMNPSHTFQNDGVYLVTLTASDSSGCASSESFSMQISVYAVPTVNAGPDLTIVSGQTGQINASGSGIPNWQPSSGLSCQSCFSPTVFVQNETQYILTVTDSFGCFSSDTILIKVIPDDGVIPNIITPNGDGSNDVFDVNAFFTPGYRLKIFNRWGQLIHESVNGDLSWGGLVQTSGEPASDGVYFYILDCNTCNNSNRKTGFLTLIR